MNAATTDRRPVTVAPPAGWRKAANGRVWPERQRWRRVFVVVALVPRYRLRRSA